MSWDASSREMSAASSLEADVGAAHIAAVYAEAFLSAAEHARRTEELLEEFGSFLSDVLDALPDLERILASQLVSPDEKAGLLDRALGPQASPLFLNFLKVVSRHGRLDLLRAIYGQAQQQYDRLRGRVRVQVATATALPEALAQRVAAALSAIVGESPIVERVVDPLLIGGIVVRVGDMVYDASVANQLRQLREQMIDRSTHEIQSRRDRFRSPAGN